MKHPHRDPMPGTLSAPAPGSADRLDWSQLWYPGPTRRFTPEELARAGGDGPDRTLRATVLLNAALACFLVLQWAPASLTAVLTALLTAAMLLGAAGWKALWLQPERSVLTRWTFMITTAMVGLGALLVSTQALPAGSSGRTAVLGVALGAAMTVTLGLWFLAVWRSQQITTRLREQADQQRTLALARQLAAAQIRPHFLANSLAALQHWVQTKDDRAAPLLEALGGFLRATLPLFDRERLPLAEEAAAVRHYLAVMALRLGPRLRWQVQVDDAAGAVPLPPGLLLTLVENAVEHGVMAALDGAEVHVAARAEAGRLVLTVRDTGPGLPATLAEGTGLANTRARLAQDHGALATLTLANAPDGGAIATLTLPLAPLHSAPGSPTA
jgi:signal transduction histidine kinase